MVLEQNWGTGAQSPKPEMCFQNGKRWFFHLPDVEEVWIHWATLILGDLLGGSLDSAQAVCEARTGQVVQ